MVEIIFAYHTKSMLKGKLGGNRNLEQSGEITLVCTSKGTFDSFDSG